MSERTGDDPAEARVGALLDADHAGSALAEPPSGPTGSGASRRARYPHLRVVGADTTVACALLTSGRLGPVQSGLNRVRTAIVSYGWLVLATMVVGFVAVLLSLHGHVDLLQAAFKKTPTAPGGNSAAAGDTTSLYNTINGLSTDATYILVPSVSLAGAVGGILWAFGAHRGPQIVAGAVVAGVVGASLDVIVK